MDMPLILEVIKIVTIVFGAVSTISALLWWIVRKYTKHLRERIALLEGQLELLEEKHENLRKGKDSLVEQLRNTQQERDKLREKFEASQENVRTVNRQLRIVSGERAKDNDAFDRHKAAWDQTLAALGAELKVKTVSHEHLQVIHERIDNISSLDGKLWNRPVLTNAPGFRARKTKIISILNLKGGVGKTTITANLAASLAERERKVLMVDLDFQRSLSRLLLSTLERKERHIDKHCVQHFLSGAVHDSKTFLKMIGEHLCDAKNCWILPNSDSVRDHSSDTVGSEDDSLEETEMRLMINWIFEREPSDIRFHLREALHGIEVEEQFEYILMDCPPRLTTACINGLAASDYVLVPVTLDAMSTNSVPYLLKSLGFLRNDILPQLKTLGIVANQVSMRDGFLVRSEQEAWDNLKDQCLRRDPALCFFKTTIQNYSAIGKFATQAIEEDDRALRQTTTYERPRENFDKLASEVVSEIEKRDGHPATPEQAQAAFA